MTVEPTPYRARTVLDTRTDIEIVDQLVVVSHLSFLDVGCGSGETARLLTERGATVVGVEPDAIQAQRNREAEPVERLSLTEGRAEVLPQADNSVDGVFFFRSLHHVAADAMVDALKEASRVVRPGGFVFVLEPSTEGTFSELIRPFHDENEVRAAAQEALNQAATKLFDSRKQYEAAQEGRYENFEALVARFVAMSFNNISADMVDSPEVRRLFEAGRTDDGYVFHQPILIDVFRAKGIVTRAKS